MTEAAAQLLATFETLDPQEQHVLLTELLRRTGELPDTLLSDEHFVGLADELFQTLDAEESDDSQPNRK